MKTKAEGEREGEKNESCITSPPLYPFPPSLPPFFIRPRLRNMSPMSPKPSPPPNPCTSSTSTSHARNDNVKDTCNAIDDSLQYTGDTIYDGHAHTTDCAKDRFDAGHNAAHFCFTVWVVGR